MGEAIERATGFASESDDLQSTHQSSIYPQHATPDLYIAVTLSLVRPQVKRDGWINGVALFYAMKAAHLQHFLVSEQQLAKDDGAPVGAGGANKTKPPLRRG